MKQPAPSNDSRNDYDEWLIYNDIKSVVKEEVSRIKKKKIRDEDDVIVLEKLTRIYANLKDDLREDLKSELWKKAALT